MMKIWNGIDDYPADAAPAVATVGNYDGVHLGHQRILASVTDDARSRDALSLLITFDPHPLAVVAPSRRPRLLCTRRQKLERLEESGLDGVLAIRFDSELAALSGEEFFGSFLLRRIPLMAIHVGSGFRFGKNRGGDLALLDSLGGRLGFEVIEVPPVRVDEEIVSSTAIRAAVADGNVRRAAALLGRPYEIEGEVVTGDGRGRGLGFPTANIATDSELIPASGVYVSEAATVDGRFASVTNVGSRPTFGEGTPVVETHLIGYEGDLYHERISLRLFERLRDEQRFAGPGELADQIARDRAAAEAYFRNLEVRFG